MPRDITIRPERPEDAEAITRVTEQAFRDHPISRQTEQFIIAALRRAGALTISLVAEEQGQVVGHIAFSPVEFSDGSAGWHGLGPLSVAPAMQGRGIGQALVRAGLGALRESGAQGCILVGPPEYYGRFGFASRPSCTMRDVPQEVVLSLTLGGQEASGEVAHHPAFGATS